MTRKDFVLIANAIRELKPVLNQHSLDQVVCVFTNQLQRHFPRFNSEKFKRYVNKGGP